MLRTCYLIKVTEDQYECSRCRSMFNVVVNTGKVTDNGVEEWEERPGNYCAFCGRKIKKVEI